MKITQRLLAATSALALSATLASAELSQDTIASLTEQLVAEGFATQIRLQPEGDEVKVIAYGAAGTTERTYTIDGTTLLEEETVGADGIVIEREYDSAGNLLEEEIEHEDDRDEDDRDEDDRDEDDHDEDDRDEDDRDDDDRDEDDREDGDDDRDEDEDDGDGDEGEDD